VEQPDEQPLEAPRAEPAPSAPALALVASSAVALIALLLAALTGGPYLDLSSLNLWVAVFAVAAFAALFSVPFAIERLLKAAHPERAEHWERAMLLWGGLATVALVLGGVLIAAGGFAPGASLADAVGLLIAIEAGMVVVTLVVWLLSS
jgi:hypothetical protein